jgi:DNA-binding MarR family transcriptional regulator
LVRLAALGASAQRLLGESIGGGTDGASAIESFILAELEDRPRRTPSQLARLTGLSRGRITHLVDRLESAGLLRRQPDNDDQRRVRLVLTAKGRQRARQAQGEIRSLEVALHRRLGAAGIDMLAQQLESLAEVAKQRTLER